MSRRGGGGEGAANIRHALNARRREARRHAHARRNPKLRRPRRRPSRDRPRTPRSPPPFTSWASASSEAVAVNAATAFRILQTNKVQKEKEKGFSFACQICAGFPESQPTPRQQSSAGRSRICVTRRSAEPPIQKDYGEEIKLFTQNLSRSSSPAPPRGAKSDKRMRSSGGEKGGNMCERTGPNL